MKTNVLDVCLLLNMKCSSPAYNSYSKESIACVSLLEYEMFCSCVPHYSKESISCVSLLKSE